MIMSCSSRPASAAIPEVSADHRPGFGNTDNEHQPEGGDGKDQVEDRARGDDGDALAHRLAVEGLLLSSGGTGASRSSSILT
jgi:hypothetical protein